MQLDNTQTKSVDELGNSTPLPGKYHALVKDVDETEAITKWNSVVVDFEILAGTVPGQEGKVIREFFPADASKPKGLERLKRFAMSIGLLGAGEAKDVPFREGVGRQLVIEVETNTYQGKTRNRVSWAGIWPLGHGEVRDVPRDAQMLAAARTPAAATTVGQAPAGAPAAAARGGWGNL